jgi:hypothetical protein
MGKYDICKALTFQNRCIYKGRTLEVTSLPGPPGAPSKKLALGNDLCQQFSSRLQEKCMFLRGMCAFCPTKDKM